MVIIGPLPPPTHGQAVVTQAVMERLKETRCDLVVINVASPSLSRTFIKRLSRVPRVLHGLIKFLFSVPFQANLYMTISGGWGQIYDIAFLWIAKMFRMKMYIHHHNYTYANSRFWLTNLICKIAGKDSVHIFLCKQMYLSMKVKYPMIDKYICLSNAFLLSGKHSVCRSRVKNIFFMSNISEEKGVFEFIELAKRMEVKQLSVSFFVVGPFQDNQTRQRFEMLTMNLKKLKYLGPLYGEDKNRFLANMDVFVFPTSYKNEAESLVILEALSHGIPVITYGRGCLSEVITPDCGKVIAPASNFIGEAMAQLEDWINHPEKFKNASRCAFKRFNDLHNKSLLVLNSLIEELSE